MRKQHLGMGFFRTAVWRLSVGMLCISVGARAITVLPPAQGKQHDLSSMIRGDQRTEKTRTRTGVFKLVVAHDFGDCAGSHTHLQCSCTQI